MCSVLLVAICEPLERLWLFRFVSGRFAAFAMFRGGHHQRAPGWPV